MITPPKNEGFSYPGEMETVVGNLPSVIKHPFTLLMVAYQNFLLDNDSFPPLAGSLLQLRNGVSDLGLGQM